MNSVSFLPVGECFILMLYLTCNAHDIVGISNVYHFMSHETCAFIVLYMPVVIC